jgi:hypothetical protein
MVSIHLNVADINAWGSPPGHGDNTLYINFLNSGLLLYLHGPTIEALRQFAQQILDYLPE